VMRCLSKVPGERFQRGFDVADALLATLTSDGALPTGAGDQVRAARVSRAGPRFFPATPRAGRT
jgi:hypothetical protein